MHTGDLATLDAQGYCAVVRRGGGPGGVAGVGAGVWVGARPPATPRRCHASKEAPTL